MRRTLLLLENRLGAFKYNHYGSNNTKINPTGLHALLCTKHTIYSHLIFFCCKLGIIYPINWMDRVPESSCLSRGDKIKKEHFGDQGTIFWRTLSTCFNGATGSAKDGWQKGWWGRPDHPLLVCFLAEWMWFPRWHYSTPSTDSQNHLQLMRFDVLRGQSGNWEFVFC